MLTDVFIRFSFIHRPLRTAAAAQPSNVGCSGPCANHSTNRLPGRSVAAPHPVRGRPTTGVGGALGTLKLPPQTTIESHPQSLFFARTRQVLQFLSPEHRGKLLFMRLQYKSVTSACEIYLGNPGLVLLQSPNRPTSPRLFPLAGTLNAVQGHHDIMPFVL